MSYLVLARKWRPASFDDVVGQEHVVRALANALDSKRLHHALLFSGTRGVGKTTIARIFAKALNCERGIGPQPCNECSACEQINAGRFVDLIEVDAASRTRVDETRELLDNVQYAPAQGRYKVYLIDEVHMLSTHSFNALLKTLEEPPPHVQFLLATTNPQKLPVTVLSRCLQFNLKRLPPDLINDRLATIVSKEGIQHDDESLRLLARAADGSMRDALSLLDQLIAFGGESLKESDARDMLGTVDLNFILRLLENLADGDGTALLERVTEMDKHVPDYVAVLRELARVLQRLAIAKTIPGVDSDTEDSEIVSTLVPRFSEHDLQLFYQICVIGSRDIALAPDPRSGFEMVLLRMLAFQPAAADGVSEKKIADPVSVKKSATRKVTAPPVLEVTGKTKSWFGEDWTRVADRLDVQGLARQLAEHTIWLERKDTVIRLRLDAAFEHLARGRSVAQLESALSAYTGDALTVDVEIGEVSGETAAKRQNREQREQIEMARQSIEEDPSVNALKDEFDATVDPESIRPIKSETEKIETRKKGTGR